MVKERRAFSTDTISATPTTEELRVGTRPVQDLSSTAEAAYHKSGLFLNPTLFNELAQVSSDIHKTRRNANHMKFNENLVNAELYDQELLLKEKQLQERNAARALTDSAMEMDAEIADTINNAEKTGGNVREAVMGLKPRWDKLNDDMYAESQLLGESFEAAKNSAFTKAYMSGINKDFLIDEAKADWDIKIATATQLQAMYRDGKNVEEVLNDLPVKIFPNLRRVDDAKDQETVNTAYNQVILGHAISIANQVANGETSVESGRNSITALMTEYMRKDLTGPAFELSDDLTSEQKIKELTVECYITKATYNSLSSILGGLKSSVLKGDTVAVYSAYKDMVEHPDYTMYTSASDAATHFANNMALIQPYADSGNSTAQTKLREMAELYYRQVSPAVTGATYYRAAMENADSPEAYANARNNIISICNDIDNYIRTGDVDSIPAYVVSDGTLNYSLNFPADDPGFTRYLESTYLDPETIKRNYYTTISRSLRELCKKYPDATTAMTLNPEYRRSSDEVISALTNYENMVRQDANNPDIVAINEVAIPDAVNALKKNRELRESLGLGYIDPTSKELIKAVVDSTKNKGMKQKTAIYQFIGTALVESGETEIFTRSKLGDLTADEQEAVNQIAAWTYIKKANELSEIPSLATQYLQSDTGNIQAPSLSNISSRIDKLDILENSKSKIGTLEADVIANLQARGIPSEFWPGIKSAVALSAAALTMKYDAEKDKISDIDSEKLINGILNGSFTNRGTFRGAAALQGISADSVDAQIELAEKELDRTLKHLEIKGTASARLDYESGKIRLYVDGRPLVGTGTYDPLKGTGLVPFGIEVSGAKPLGMDQETFNNAQRTMIQSAVYVSGLTNLRNNPKLQKILEGYAPGVSIESAEKYGYTYLNMLAQEDVQRDYYKCVNSNFANIELVSAPEEFKKVLRAAYTPPEVAGEEIIGSGLFYSDRLMQGASKYITPGAPLLRLVTSKIMSEYSPKASDVLKSTKELSAGVRNKAESIGAHFKGESSVYMKTEDTFRDIDLLADYLYTRNQNANTMRIDTPKSLTQESKGFPITDIDAQVRSCGYGWKVTSSVGDKHSPFSKHPRGEAADIGGEGGFYTLIDPSTQEVRPGALKALYAGFFKQQISLGNIDKIICDRPEVLEMFSGVTNSKGKSIAIKSGKNDHWDHIHVEFNRKMYDANGKPVQTMNPKIKAQMGVAIHTNLNGNSNTFCSTDEARSAAANYYSYKPTEWDAQLVGRPLSEISNNPTLQAQTALVKIKQGQNATGSMDMAIAGMHGAKFKVISTVKSGTLVNIPVPTPYNIFNKVITGEGDITSPKVVRGKQTNVLKDPNREFTLEEIISMERQYKLRSKGLIWKPADRDYKKKYARQINNWAREAN